MVIKMRTFTKTGSILLSLLLLYGCSSVKENSSTYIATDTTLYAFDAGGSALKTTEEGSFSSALTGSYSSASTFYSGGYHWYVTRRNSTNAWIERISKDSLEVQSLPILNTPALCVSEKGICTAGFFNSLQFNVYDLNFNPIGTFSLDYMNGEELTVRTLKWYDGSYYLLLNCTDGHNWYSKTENHLLKLTENFELEQVFDLGLYNGTLTDFVQHDQTFYFVQYDDGVSADGSSIYSGAIWSFDLKTGKSKRESAALEYRYPTQLYISNDGKWLTAEHDATRTKTARPLFSILSLENQELYYLDTSDDLFWGIDSSTKVWVSFGQDCIYFLYPTVLVKFSTDTGSQTNFPLDSSGIENATALFL